MKANEGPRLTAAQRQAAYAYAPDGKVLYVADEDA